MRGRAGLRWELRPEAALLWALMYFFDSAGLTAALLPAAIVHELGHVLALRLCRCPLRRVRLGLFGAELDYAGSPGRWEKLFCAAAGPAAGVLWALFALRRGGAYLRLSGEISLLLSAFNLLPVLPLDGGRIAEALLGERAARVLSLAAAAALSLGGIVLLWRFRAFGAAVMGFWLLARQRAARRTL